MYTDKINSILNQMTLRQKLGQLIISRYNAREIDENVAKGEIGGLYFASIRPDFKERIAEFKKLSPFPLFIAQDLELGKTAEGPVWPTAMAVSSADSEEDAYLWAYSHGKQARSLGVNAAFGPVLDVALSDKAENTGFRSVGDSPHRVGKYCSEMMRGYSDAGIYSFSKHFPGFGRAVGDPHMELSKLECDFDTIYKEELLPYTMAVENKSIAGIMTGHVIAEKVDKYPSTVSKKWLDILKNELGFDGLVMTDSLTMQGILQYDNSRYLYENTIIAGHDMFLTNASITDSECLDYLEDAVNSGRLPLEVVEEKVRRILKVKLELEDFETLAWDESENKELYNRINENAQAYIRADGGAFIPLDKDKSCYCIVFTDDPGAIDGELSGANANTAEIYKKLTEEFPRMKVEFAPVCPSPQQIQKILGNSLDYESVVVIGNTSCMPYTGFDCLSYQVQAVIRALAHKLDTLVVIGTPYSYKAVKEYVPQALFAFDSNVVIFDKVLSGKLKPEGKLPVKL